MYRLVGAALAAGVLVAGVLAYMLAREEKAHAETKRVYAEAAAHALDAVRTEEHRRIAAIQKTVEAAHAQTEAARADARRARAAGDRLRGAAANAAAVACPDRPAIASDGPPASTAADLLAELLGRADEAAGELARAADEARIAGAACERAYDSLTRTP